MGEVIQPLGITSNTGCQIYHSIRLCILTRIQLVGSSFPEKVDQMISMLRKCIAGYLKRTHKFGIKLPQMVHEACAIDENNSKIFWQDAIWKEIEYLKIAFQIIPKGNKPVNGFQYINCHMVFHIKMEKFQRKACLIRGGHINKTLDTITYSIVVRRETLQVVLTMAVVHDL